jgi:hypothetical protein
MCKLNILYPLTSLGKKNILYGKNVPWMVLLEHWNFILFTRDTKDVLFSKNLCVHRECSDIRADILTDFFDILKCFFKQ